MPGLWGVFLNRLSRWLGGLIRWSYGWSFALIIAVFVGGSVCAIYFMGSQVVSRVDEFVDEFGQAQTEVSTYFKSNRWWGQFIKSVGEGRRQPSWSEAISTATSAASDVVTVLAAVILVLFLGFYFALQPKWYRQGTLALVPPRYRAMVEDFLQHSSDALWRWMLGRLVGMAVIGVGSALGLWIIGISLPVTLGVLAGLMNFVPNIGPLISAIPPAVFALALGGNTVFYVLALYVVLQFIESYFLTPLITQHQVDLPPGLTLSAQLLFSMLAGVLGLLFATPLMVVVHVAVRDFHIAKLGKNGPQNGHAGL